MNTEKHTDSLLIKAQRPIFIYLILDDAESPRYVGQTYKPAKRYIEHARNHPEWAISYRVIERVSDSDRWQDRERYWIKYYRRFASLENIARGGGWGGTKSADSLRRFREKMIGRKQSPESTAKRHQTIKNRTPERQAEIGRRISKSKKGKVPNWSSEGKQRIINSLKSKPSPMLGKTHSEETRKIIGEKSKGHPPNKGSFQKGVFRPKSESWKRKRSASQKGKKLAESTKEKIRAKRALQVLRPLSPESRKKIGDSQRGKPKNWKSEEAKNYLGEWARTHPGTNLGVKRSAETKRKASETKKESLTTLRADTHPNAKLTTEKVRSIRWAFKVGIRSKKELALDFGVSLATIKAIISRKLWSSIS